MMTIDEAVVALQNDANARKTREQELVDLSADIIAHVTAQFQNDKFVVTHENDGRVRIARSGSSHRYAELSPMQSGRVLFRSTEKGAQDEEMFIYEDALKAVVKALQLIAPTRPGRSA